MQEWLWNIFTYLMQIGGAGVIVLTFIGLAPARVGERLFGHYFDRKLADLKLEHDSQLEDVKHAHDSQLAEVKHDYDAQIEELKSKLARLGDRGVRSNEREFNATVAAWEAFVEAFDASQRCVISYIQHPDLSKMAETDVAEFLASTELSERQKNEIIRATDKNTAYANVLRWSFVFEAQKALYNARIVLRKQVIFITAELSDKISKVLDLCSEAVIEHETGMRHGSREIGTTTSVALIEKRAPLYSEVLAMVRGRLFNA
ncbi:hypothetical protein SAMN05444161_5578 [Rhizobiales bacterium GAS191]|nr:hypothetical protein SAMN05444161_5578 [Rhizobiales bacterium GAS191]